MKLLKRRQTRQKRGLAPFLHILLKAILPIAIYILVRLEFVAFAFAVVLLSKWRIIAVKVRHWPANFRSNVVDILVGISTVIFVSLSGSQAVQVAWIVGYMVWLLYIKPKSTELWVGLQALIAQTMALVAIFLVWNEASETGLVFAVWVVTYFCARHFLGAFDESMSRASAYVWAFFCASLTWLTSHWLIYYKVISQPALIITVIGYGMAAMYYLKHTERLKKGVIRQFVIIMVAIISIILVYSNWSGDVI